MNKLGYKQEKDMIRFGMLAVLLTSILVAGCGNSPQSNDTNTNPGEVAVYVENTYRIKEVSLVSADGTLLVKLADDKNNDPYSGHAFRVHVNGISVGINNELSSTHVRIRGRGNRINLFQVYEAMIIVRTDELRKKWGDFFAEEKNRIYGPRDIYPPISPQLAAKSGFCF